MKIVFFGTPDYVLPVLEAVFKRFSRRGVSPIAAVVTQPPRPVGRKQLLSFSPVDSWAFKKKVPIYHEARQILKESPEANLGILASYGAIIPKEIIEFFPHGILNVHPSLLPKWRGASPIQAPFIAGEEKTGVSIIKLDEKLDHGPIVSQFREEILETDTAGTLRERLFARSAGVLVELLDPYLKGKITPREQNHSEATFTNQIKKEDAFIPAKYLGGALEGKHFKAKWEIGFMKARPSQASLMKDFTLTPSPTNLNQFFKAMSPWPQAWTYVNLGKKGHKDDKKRLKIISAHLEKTKLVLDTVQLEGKGPVAWQQFREAYKDAAFAE